MNSIFSKKFIFTKKNMAKKTQKPEFQLKNSWVFLAIAILCFILYGKSISNGYNIDDNYVIENHKLALQGIDAIPEIFTSRYHDQDGFQFGYRPLTIAVYAIEWDIFVNLLGVNQANFPAVGHFFNIVYYIVFCSLLFITIKYLFSKFNYAMLLAALTTLIFIVHPIHTEVILSLKNREEIISGLFGLLALYQALRYFDTKRLWQMLIAITALLLAFLAKESAVVFLLIIPVCYAFSKSTINVLKWFKPRNIGSYLIVILWVLSLITLSSLKEVFFSVTSLIADNIFFIFSGFSFKLIFLFYFIIHAIGGVASLYVKGMEVFVPKIKNAWNVIAFALMLAGLISSVGVLCVTGMLIYNILLTRRYGKSEINTESNQPEILQSSPLKINRKLVLIAIAAVMISVVAISAVYYAQSKALPEVNAPVYKWQNPAFDFSKDNQELAAIVFVTIGYYVKMLLIPYPLRFYYGYKMIPDVSISDLSVIISITCVLLMLIFSVIGFNRRKPYGLGILIFLIAIAPFSNLIFPLAGIVAERLLFIPSIGFSLILAWGILWATKSLQNSKSDNKKFTKPMAIGVALMIPFMVISFDRNSDWKDRTTLYRTDIEHLENSAKANNLYANLLIGQVYTGIQAGVDITPVKGNIELALKYYKQAIAVDSTYANPYHNIGYIYLIIYKDYSTATHYFDICIKLDSSIDEAFLNRGIAAFSLKQYTEAKLDLNHYLSLSEKMQEKAFYYLAKSHIETGDTATGDTYFIKVIDTNTSTKQINEEIFDYFFFRKKYNEAIMAAKSLTKMDGSSDKPYVDMGNCYLLMGDTVQAIQQWEIAFEKFNGNYNIAMTISGYYAGKGNQEKANYYYQKAVAYRQTHPK